MRARVAPTPRAPRGSAPNGWASCCSACRMPHHPVRPGQVLADQFPPGGCTKPDLSNAESAAKEFRERLGEEYRKAQEEFRQIRRDVNQWGMVTAGATAAQVAKAIVTGGLDLKM